MLGCFGKQYVFSFCFIFANLLGHVHVSIQLYQIESVPYWDKDANWVEYGLIMCDQLTIYH